MRQRNSAYRWPLNEYLDIVIKMDNFVAISLVLVEFP